MLLRDDLEVILRKSIRIKRYILQIDIRCFVERPRLRTAYCGVATLDDLQGLIDVFRQVVPRFHVVAIFLISLACAFRLLLRLEDGYFLFPPQRLLSCLQLLCISIRRLPILLRILPRTST